MLLSLLLFESEFLHIVAISYTALVINELIMVSLEITTWHTYMILSLLGTALVYFGSMPLLPAYFGQSPFLRQTCRLIDRSIFRSDDTICLQGRDHCCCFEFPIVHDQGISSSLQAGCLCQSGGYIAFWPVMSYHASFYRTSDSCITQHWDEHILHCTNRLW